MSTIKDINSNSLVSYSNLNESSTHSHPIVDFEDMPLGILDPSKILEFQNLQLFIGHQPGVMSEITEASGVLPYISGRHISTDSSAVMIRFIKPVTQVTFAVSHSVNGEPKDFLVNCSTVANDGAQLTLSGDAQWFTLTAKNTDKITQLMIFNNFIEPSYFRLDNISTKL